jgi:hypothetical protein
MNMKYTQMEQTVFNTLALISLSGGVADIAELVEATDIPAAQARGVIASLVKKGKVDVEEMNEWTNTQILYWPVHPEHGGGIFWTDHCEDAEGEAGLIKDSEVHGDTAPQAAPANTPRPQPSTKNVKIGRNKNHARILIENQVFVRFGWLKGQHINIEYNHAAQSIIITKADSGPNKLGGRQRGNAMQTRIELGDADLTAFVGGYEVATITYAVDQLTFTIGASV